MVLLFTLPKSGRLREEEIPGVEIAVDDPLRLRERQRVDRRIEERDDLRERALPRIPLELGRERVPVEPLEDHVRHEGARDRRHGGARRHGACNVQVPLRELVVEPALVAEPLDERLDELRAELRGQLHALDGDGLREPEVVARVHHAEPALADETIDAELAIEDLTYEAERIGRSHGRSLPEPRSGRAAQIRDLRRYFPDTAIVTRVVTF